MTESFERLTHLTLYRIFFEQTARIKLNYPNMEHLALVHNNVKPNSPWNLWWLALSLKLLAQHPDPHPTSTSGPIFPSVTNDSGDISPLRLEIWNSLPSEDWDDPQIAPDVHTMIIGFPVNITNSHWVRELLTNNVIPRVETEEILQVAQNEKWKKFDNTTTTNIMEGVM